MLRLTLRFAPVFPLAVCVSACAFGPMHRVEMGGLGRYARGDAVHVDVRGPAPAGVRAAAARGVADGVHARTGLRPDGAADPHAYRLELHVQSTAPTAPRQSSFAGGMLSIVQPGRAGSVHLEGRLFEPGGASVGSFRWDAHADPSRAALAVGREAGRALGASMVAHRDALFDRRPADERLLLTPTPLTLPAGDWAVSNDEALLFRVATGLTDHVQLDFWLGALPIPAAGGTFLPPLHVLGAVGGAGGVLLGAADIGLKVRLLDETRVLPNVSLSYDMLDVFGTGLAAGGIAIAGNGVAAGAGGALGGANAQFNLVSLAVSKHFGSTQLIAGTYVLDNHHYLPQSVHFEAGFVAAGSGGAATGSTSGGAELPRLPIQVQPFLSLDQPVTAHISLSAELLPRLPVDDSMTMLGFRWTPGFGSRLGPLALERIHLRVDAGMLLFYARGADTTNADGTTRHTSGGVGGLPWLGLGAYFD